jgi:hypothetical protein
MAGGAAAQKQLDEEGRSILYEGASVSQLAKLFLMDNRSVAEKLHGVEPCGQRAGFPVYAVRDAARRLAPLDEDEIETRLRRMNPAELPKMLSKELWAGMMQRRRYEQAVGELWSTEEVRTAATEMLKALRTDLLLLPERVADRLNLQHDKREVVQREVDNMMEALRARFDNALRDSRSAVLGTVESEDGEL